VLRRFTTAIAFLTRIPVNPKQAHTGEDVARSSVFFPLVGCVLAAIQILFLWGLHSVGVPYVLQAIAATAVLFVAGGGLHQDGLADMADGFGGGFTKDKVLHIMRDSTIGTYGGLALLIAFSTRIASLSYISAVDGAWVWIFVAAAVSRCSIVLGWLMPYARDSGTGQSVTQLTGPSEVVGACLSAVLIAVLCVGTQAFSAVFIALIIFSIFAWICHRKINGVTGDTLGATTETTEVVLLALGATISASIGTTIDTPLGAL